MVNYHLRSKRQGIINRSKYRYKLNRIIIGINRANSLFSTFNASNRILHDELLPANYEVAKEAVMLRSGVILFIVEARKKPPAAHAWISPSPGGLQVQF